MLYALSMAGYPAPPEHVDWLARHATTLAPGGALGLYDGLHGAAYALDHLGRRDTALDVLDICLRERWTDLGSDLSGGLAGIGLNLAHFAACTGEPALSEAAERTLDMVADRLGDVESVPTVSGGPHPYAGLLRGSSGAALLFLRAYERTGESGLLDLAGTALRQDLRRCTVLRDGSMHVNEDWRTMPYLLNGSLGIGMVLDDYLRHRPEEDLLVAAEQIRRAAGCPFVVQSGLFSGRAGLILYLSRRAGAEHAAREAAAEQISRLSWHAVRYQEHLAFPGEQLLRLSQDLATGGAGVLLAVAAAIDPNRAYLPFLAPTPPPISGLYPGTA